MRTIIFSKQADCDLDLVPFWYYWYSEIFKPDFIVITPVKTPLSSIDGVTEFYRERDIPVIPIIVSTWDDKLIWDTQRKLMEQFVNPGEDFVALSADTDQYFEPFAELKTAKCVYHRINFALNGTPTPSNLEQIHMRAFASFDLIGGYVNDLSDPDVSITGHYQGSLAQVPKSEIRREFHLHLRGFESFLRKVNNIAINVDGDEVGGSWKNWRRILENRGETALSFEYDAIVSEMTKEREEPDFVELFKKYAEQRQTADTTELDISRRFAYPSALGVFGVNGKNSNFGIYAPVTELDSLNIILQGIKYPSLKLSSASKKIRVLDVGAHLGFFPIWLASNGIEAEFICVEPSMANCSVLKKNLQQIPSVVICQTAIGEIAGTSPLYIHPSETGGHSLVSSFTGIPNEQLENSQIEVTTGDALVAEHLNGQVDIIKISVNGSEVAALRGLKDSLVNALAVFIEYGLEESRTDLETLLPGFVFRGVSRSANNKRGVFCFTKAK